MTQPFGGLSVLTMKQRNRSAIQAAKTRGGKGMVISLHFSAIPISCQAAVISWGDEWGMSLNEAAGRISWVEGKARVARVSILCQVW